MDKILRNGSAHQILKARGFSEKKTPDFFRVFLFYFNSQMCPQPVLQGSFDCNFRILSKQKSLQNPQHALGQSVLVRRAGIFCVPRRTVCAVVAAFFVKQNFCRSFVDKRLLLTVCSFCFWGSGRTPCCSRDALSAALFPYRGKRRRQACRQRSKTPYCFLRKVCPPDI